MNVNDIEINTDVIEGPVVVLIGPPASGKTVALIRLINYLDNKNIKVEPNYGLIDSEEYVKVCDRFMTMAISPTTTPPRTGSVEFLLLNVFKDNAPFCQILEAPGEAYFSPGNPGNPDYNYYISKILFQSHYKKTLVFFFEDNMLDNSTKRAAYARRAADIIGRIDTKKTRIIFLYNKADRHSELMNGGRVNKKVLKDKILNNPSYRVLREAINASRGMKPIMFLAYSGGSFHSGSDGVERWALSQNHYPECFWANISESIQKTSWFNF